MTSSAESDTFLAYGRADGAISLHDKETEQLIGGPLAAHDTRVTALAFRRDGKRLASADSQGTILLWPVGIQAWQERACDIAGRVLTPDEAKLYLGVAHYRSACPLQPREGEVPAPTIPAQDSPDMVKVDAGWFLMGCNENADEDCMAGEDTGRVFVDTFYIDRTEVTVAQYRACVEAGACTDPGIIDREACNWQRPDSADHPINCVNWFQASKYCHWKDKRLPLEAEWEKAARGEDGRKFPWGNNEFSATSEKWANVADLVGTDYKDGFKMTAPVGTFPRGASPDEALDMAGNVYEWVSDRIAGGRGMRGGSFKQEWYFARTSYRRKLGEKAQHDDVGFRCAR
jgi:formylglycine-generating enzyme required for sulfatase activity